MASLQLVPPQLSDQDVWEVTRPVRTGRTVRWMALVWVPVSVLLPELKRDCRMIPRILMLLLTSAAAAAQSPSTVLFTDDFEVQDFSAWTNGATQTNASSIGVVAHPRHSGAWSLKTTVTPDSGARTALLRTNFTPQPHLYASVWFYIDTRLSLPVGTGIQLLQVLNSRAWSGVTLGLATQAGALVLTANQLRGTAAIEPGRWHCVEVHYQAESSSGTASVSLNGNSELILSGAVLRTPDTIRLGIETRGAGVSGTIYFDDVNVGLTPMGDILSALTVRHPNTASRLGIPVDVVMFGHATTDALVASIDGSTIYRKSRSLLGHERFYVDLRAMAAGEHTFRVELQREDGTVKATYSGPLRKALTGSPAVAIDEHNNIWYDNSRRFVITPFEIDHPANWQFWHDNGYVNSHGWMAGYRKEGYSKESYKEYVESIRTQCIGPDGRLPDLGTRFGNSPDAPLIVGEYAKYLRDNPYVAMWTWVDEPDRGAHPGNTPAPNLRLLTEATHNNDPYHPVITNLYGWTPAVSRRRGYTYPIVPDNSLGLVSDVYAWDMYPLIYQRTGATIAQWVANMEAWKRYTYDLTPWMAFVESGVQTGGSATHKGPTPAQLRMEAWLAVIHGMKGIAWWGPEAFTTLSPEHRAEQARFVAEIHQFENVLLSPPPNRRVITDATLPGRRVDAMIREQDGTIYIFAARLTDIGEEADPAIPVQFTIPGLGDTIATTVFPPIRTISVTTGTFSDTVSPFAVQAYRIRLR